MDDRRRMAVVLRAPGALRDVEQAFACRDCPDVPVMTVGRESMTEVIQRLIHSGIDTLVIGGGDGTLNEAVNVVMPLPTVERPVLGLLPLGTGNDFARCCDLPLGDVEAAVEHLLSAQPTPVDVMQVNDRYCINAITGGDLTQVTTAAPDALKQGLGRFVYWWRGLHQTLALNAHQVRFEGPAFEWEGACYAFAINNGCFVSGGIRISNDANPHDGLLRLSIVPEEAPVAKVAMQGMMGTGGGSHR
ncbi:MAG: hypothetical protein RhofKO_36740 [Rhodothermales bacterium]